MSQIARRATREDDHLIAAGDARMGKRLPDETGASTDYDAHASKDAGRRPPAATFVRPGNNPR